jgi:hypothetical protein
MRFVRPLYNHPIKLVYLFTYVITTITIPNSESNLSSKLFPIIDAARGLLFRLAIAHPGVVDDTNTSPFLTDPTTLQGTFPRNATASPSESLFIRYAGLVDITPATLVSSSIVVIVISLTPPNTTTVPGSYSESASYFSAKSAYRACVAIAVITLAEKLPDEFLATIVLGVLASVALKKFVHKLL